VSNIPAVHPFVGQDLNTALAERSARRGEHPYIVWSPSVGVESVITYEQFASRSEEVAGGLGALGIGQGDRVLVMLDNCPELLLTLFACARLGAVAVTINTRSVADEVSYYAEHSSSKIAVTQPAYVAVVAEAVPAMPIVTTTYDGGEPVDQRCAATAHIATLSFDDLRTPEGADVPTVEPDPWRDLCVQYTSGTTARPKGVVWTHANALWGASVNARHTGLVADDVYLTHLPLFHTNALSYSALGTFWVGGTVVLLPKFSASRFWDVSTQYGCTVTSMIPFCVKALAGRPIPEHSYRVWGSPICDPPYDEVFGVKSVGWWGMTETITHGIVGDVDQSNTPMTCGRPAVEYELRITGDDGGDVAPGETGALGIRGVPGLSLFSRYLDDNEATKSSFDDDKFFLTGDRVTLLADGHIRFADRDKDMMKVGGENVAASEVERVVIGVPGVAEVAVVARPDDMLHEVPVAFIVGNGTVDDDALVAAVVADSTRLLAPFKVPREVFVVADLPRSTLNKVAKAELRERLRPQNASIP
jgi:carnitine-CoA ligase